MEGTTHIYIVHSIFYGGITKECTMLYSMNFVLIKEVFQLFSHAVSSFDTQKKLLLVNIQYLKKAIPQLLYSFLFL